MIQASYVIFQYTLNLINSCTEKKSKLTFSNKFEAEHQTTYTKQQESRLFIKQILLCATVYPH